MLDVRHRWGTDRMGPTAIPDRAAEAERCTEGTPEPVEALPEIGTRVVVSACTRGHGKRQRKDEKDSGHESHSVRDDTPRGGMKDRADSA